MCVLSFMWYCLYCGLSDVFVRCVVLFVLFVCCFLRSCLCVDYCGVVLDRFSFVFVFGGLLLLLVFVFCVFLVAALFFALLCVACLCCLFDVFVSVFVCLVRSC